MMAAMQQQMGFHHHGGMGVVDDYMDMFAVPGGGGGGLFNGGGQWGDYNVGKARRGNEDYGQISRVEPVVVQREAVAPRNGVQPDSLTRSLSLGSSASEDSGPQQQQQQKVVAGASQQQQPSYGAPGPGPSLPMNFAKTENVMLVGEMDSHNAQSLGKRFREDDDNHPRTTGVMPNGGPGSYPAPGGVQPGQPLPGMGARPRVRARRGQATDPHSIAERLRRERIAERMRALQELVPNSNKTDKASMLDEIIDYVKFLQLQVKVLSMSRLGSAGALPSLVNDMPAEGGNNFSTSAGSSGVTNPGQDGLALTERQVTRMMEDDMGSAMQYLQSKGLCLMPISLATAISTTNKGPNAAPSNNGKAPATAAAGPSSKEDASEGET